MLRLVEVGKYFLNPSRVESAEVVEVSVDEGTPGKRYFCVQVFFSGGYSARLNDSPKQRFEKIEDAQASLKEVVLKLQS